MWLLGESAAQLLYSGPRMTHGLLATKSGVSMLELTRALTVRATYQTINDIP